VHIRRLWRFIAKNGSSSAHFTLYHKANALQFEGMTDQEWNDAEANDD
jgi:hypothetical protein